MISKINNLFALSQRNIKNAINILMDEGSHKFGIPDILMSDNGQEFVCRDFTSFLEPYDIRLFRTVRVNQATLAAIRSYLRDDQRD